MVVAWLVIIGSIAGWVAYGNWLKSGIKPRRFVTTLGPHDVRSLFTDRVARTGWKIVDDGNPLVAQSSLVTGIRQQIGVEVARAANGQTSVQVGPNRIVTKYGVPKKGHTIRLRLNSFVGAVRAHDPFIDVQSVGRR